MEDMPLEIKQRRTINLHLSQTRTLFIFLLLKELHREMMSCYEGLMDMGIGKPTSSQYTWTWAQVCMSAYTHGVGFIWDMIHMHKCNGWEQHEFRPVLYKCMC
jgi:hypothetical protein